MRKTIINSIVLIALIAVLIFGLYTLAKIAKTISYQVFYKSQVIETIQKTVKPDALK